MKYRILQTAPDVFVPQYKEWHDLKWQNFERYEEIIDMDFLCEVEYKTYEEALNFIRSYIKKEESQKFKPIIYPVDI